MNDYQERIDRVIEFIRLNYAKRVTLIMLADKASFSLYHFSRVFLSFTDTTPMRFLRDVRLEKAAHFLLNSSRSVAEIALACGFESLSVFNTSFRERYGDTPSRIRKYKNSNISKENGNRPGELRNRESHTLHKSFLRRVWNMNVDVKDFPEYEIAYFRHVGSYLDAPKNWNRLLEWVSRKGLWKTNPLFIGISHDDPETTEEDACRHDACVTLPAGFARTGDNGVNYGTIPAGKYAVYHFYDTIEKLAIVFKSLFREWLPQSGYEFDDRPCLEINLNNPADDPEHKGRTDVCIPVK
ncbi:MAG: AraC family transcriptional regulator [Spirochaetales bacterium]|nr:AraC family transcriptional regulator [Spirochaetales bacterium]